MYVREYYLPFQYAPMRMEYLQSVLSKEQELLNTDFNPVGAVYFITRRTTKPDGGGTHTHIYVGQTSDISQRLDSHHKINCFLEHNANCICIYREDNENTRVRIEADLIENYNPPCND